MANDKKTERLIVKNALENPFRTTKELAEMNLVKTTKCSSILKKRKVYLTKRRKKIVKELYQLKKEEISLYDEENKTKSIVKTLKEFPFIPKRILADKHNTLEGYITSCLKQKGYVLRKLRKEKYDEFYHLINNKNKAI